MKIQKNFLLGVASLLIIGIISGYFYCEEVIKKTPFNLTFLGEDFSRIPISEAREKASQKIKSLIAKKVIISFEEKSVFSSLSQLGLINLCQDKLDSFFSPSKNPFKFISSFFNQTKIPFNYEFDQELVLKFINSSFGDLYIIKQDAKFILVGKYNLKIEKEVIGEQLDLPAFIEKLESKDFILKTQISLKIPLKKTVPRILEADLELIKPRVLDLLKKGLVLKSRYLNWKIKFKELEWFEFIAINLPEFNNKKFPPLSFSKKIKITLNEEKLNQFLEDNIYSKLNKEHSKVKIWQDQDESIQFEGQGLEGFKVKENILKSLIVYNLNSSNSETLIPLKTIPPEVEVDKNLQKLGIKELIGTGYSDFRGSSYSRIHNVKVGMQVFTGKLIPPGEVFSFNKNLGQVGPREGYRKELVIKNNKTEPDYGGGLCQVSSTFFRAALWTGLEIIERKPHSYAVPYYARPGGHGLDATIFLGGPDLKIKNDTNHHLLVQGYTDGTLAYFLFYGTSDQRKVNLGSYQTWGYKKPSAPIFIKTTELAPGVKKREETPHTGFSASWERTITKEDKVSTEVITSKYQPWSAKYLIGVSESELSEE